MPWNQEREREARPMCSNNTNNNVGVRWVANASGVVGDHEHEISSLKKAKKQRIPKRGPGVAELEKILREQEKKDGHVEKGKINGGFSSSLVPSQLPNFASSSSSLQRNVTANSTVHLPPVSPLHFNGNGDIKGSSQLGFGDVGGNGRTKGVYIGGSGVLLPEQTLLPITWGSCEARKGEEAPKMATDFSFPILVSNGSDHTKVFPPPMVQKNLCHPSMKIGLDGSEQMNLFPLSEISSPATPSSSSAGVYHHVEPPSNQKSCHNYTSTLPEEDKMIGAKRSRPNFPVDNWLPAPPHVPSQPPPFHHLISRLDPSASSSNNAVFNLGIASREPMPSSPLELKVKTCVNGHGNPSGNGSALITLGSPTTSLSSTQNCQQDFPKFIKQFPFQGMKERSSSGSELSSVHKKSSFFSLLLQPQEQRGAAEATLSSKNIEKCTEKTGDQSIDLSLKL